MTPQKDAANTIKYDETDFHGDGAPAGTENIMREVQRNKTETKQVNTDEQIAHTTAFRRMVLVSNASSSETLLSVKIPMRTQV